MTRPARSRYRYTPGTSGRSSSFRRAGASGSIGSGAGHDQDLLQVFDAVAVRRRLLEAHLLGGRPHFGLQAADLRLDLLRTAADLLPLLLLQRHLEVVGLVDAPEDVVDRLDDRLGGDAVLLVIGPLDGAPAAGLVESGAHRVGRPVGVHQDPAVDVAGGAAAGLDERAGRAQVPFLVGVENRHERHLRQVETLAQEVDADQDVELPLPEIPEDVDPLQGVDFGVQVLDAHAQIAVVAGQLLGHPLGERGDEDALPLLDALPDLVQEIVHLVAHRTDLDHRIHQAGRPDDLLDDLPLRHPQL